MQDIVPQMTYDEGRERNGGGEEEEREREGQGANAFLTFP